MMNGPKPGCPSGGRRRPSPKRRRPGLRVSCSPSPQPSPQGEGETFARALRIRPSMVGVCLRNERQRRGDCKQNVRIFQYRANALPLLGERAGVRGNEANSKPKRTTTPGTVKRRESPGRYGFSPERCLVAQICNLPYRRFVIGRASESSNTPGPADVQQNAILRYSRLQICATPDTSPDRAGGFPI